jgi:tRNA A-37 threonylcarbamoyl transferase component Bud32
VLKRYNLRKAGNLFKDVFRRSKARRAFRKAYHLELTGVPTARPIATADKRVLGLLVASYFLMEEIPGAIHLGQWRGDNEAALQRLAELLARLHDEGFSHRDLKETNIVFDSQNRILLIDLEGLEFLDTVSRTRADADLARLIRAMEELAQFSEADRARVLALYRTFRSQ